MTALTNDVWHSMVVIDQAGTTLLGANLGAACRSDAQ